MSSNLVKNVFNLQSLHLNFREYLQIIECRMKNDFEEKPDRRGSTYLPRIRCRLWRISTNNVLESLNARWITPLNKCLIGRAPFISDRALLLDELNEDALWSSFDSSRTLAENSWHFLHALRLKLGLFYKWMGWTSIYRMMGVKPSLFVLSRGGFWVVGWIKLPNQTNQSNLD